MDKQGGLAAAAEAAEGTQGAAEGTGRAQGAAAVEAVVFGDRFRFCEEGSVAQHFDFRTDFRRDIKQVVDLHLLLQVQTM